MKRIIGICLLTVLLFSNAVFAAEQAAKVNIALGKSVVAENTHGASYTAKNAVDGNSSSIWSGPDNGGDFIIDLGGFYSIDTVELQARQNMDQPFDFPKIYGSSADDFIQFEVLSEVEFTVPARETRSVKSESDEKFRYIKLTFSDYASVAEIRIFEKALPENGINATEVNYSDVTDVNLQNALGLLGGFSIDIAGGEGSFFGDKEVTRAEFCHFLVRTMGFSHTQSVKAPFIDISGIPEQSSIEALYSINAVDGYAAGLFKPQLSINVYDAAEIAVRALGYGKLIEQSVNGNYVLKSKIAELKLLSGVAGSGKLTRKDAAIMLTNVLNAKVLDIKAISDGNVEYMTGKTLLNCRDVYWNEGVVTENYTMSLNHEWKGVSKGRVVIEDSIFDVAYNSLMYHVGDKVRYYYKEIESGNDVIIFMHKVTSQKEIQIAADDVENIIGRTVKYYENDKLKTKSFASGARVIYNGRPLSGNKDINSYKPVCGYVKMLDYDGNNTYDTVIIFNYEDRVVKRINKRDNTYYFEGKKSSVTIDNEKTAVFYNSGKIANPLSIKPGDVLSIGTSIDGKHYEIYISTAWKDGKITELSEGKEKSVTIDYLKTYSLSKDFNNPSDVKLGERGCLYINYEGKGVFFGVEKLSSYYYGFLTNAKIDGVFEDVLKVQIYTQNATLETFTVRKNSVLDAHSYTSPTVFLSDLEGRLLNSEGKYVDCLVRYKINLDLEIYEIDTLYDNKEIDGLSKISDIKDKYIMYGIFDGKYILDSSTTVFYAYDEENPEERYEVKTVSESFKDRNYYTLEVYGDNSDILSVIPVALVRKQNSVDDVGDDAYAVLVDKVVSGLNQNEEIVPVIYGMYKGEYTKIAFSDSDDIPSWIEYLSFGDILRITTNKYNEIAVCEFTGEFDAEAPATDTVLNIQSTPKLGNHMSPRFMMLGGVYDLNDTIMCLKPGENMESKDDFHLVYTERFENIYLCDTKAMTVKKGTVDEVSDYLSDNLTYSNVYCRLNSGYHRDLIIYSR